MPDVFGIGHHERSVTSHNIERRVMSCWRWVTLTSAAAPRAKCTTCSASTAFARGAPGARAGASKASRERAFAPRSAARPRPSSAEGAAPKSWPRVRTMLATRLNRLRAARAKVSTRYRLCRRRDRLLLRRLLISMLLLLERRRRWRGWSLRRCSPHPPRHSTCNRVRNQHRA